MEEESVNRKHTANAQACQQRCQNTDGCAHFSWWVDNSNCHTSGAGSARESEQKAVSGGKDCAEVCYSMSVLYNPLDLDDTDQYFVEVGSWPNKRKQRPEKTS